MKTISRCLILLFLVGGGINSTFAQRPQIADGFENTIGKSVGNPPGQLPDVLNRTGRQFESTTAFGGWRTTQILSGTDVLAGSVTGSVGAPGEIKRPGYTPLAADGVTELPALRIEMDSVRMAMPLSLRAVTFPLGSVIPRPSQQLDGSPAGPNYYLAEPVFTSSPQSGDFYYSPHADKVFAIKPGNIEIKWKVRGDDLNGLVQSYVISGTSVKPTRTIFWTEAGKGYNGPLVTVPSGRVQEVHIAYFDSEPGSQEPTPVDLNTGYFPERVSVDYYYRDRARDEDSEPAEEFRTLWFEKGVGPNAGSFHAYNIEGRVFVEYLGNFRDADRINREHLGFEVVDVKQTQRADPLRVNVGDRLFPSEPAAVTEIEKEFIPYVAAGGFGVDAFIYTNRTLAGTEELYAVRSTTPTFFPGTTTETVSNEALVYWKESGELGISWPKKYVSYLAKWPEEFQSGWAELSAAEREEYLRDYYSIYARPANDTEAAATGVRLPSVNNPSLVFQDNQQREHAFLTPEGVFYTVAGAGSRSLIRYQVGEQVWFERVYSLPSTGFEAYGSPGTTPVGQRIEAPAAAGPGAVGYIHTSKTGPMRRDAYNPGAYIDPIVEGLEEAATGAIIPVNALPSNNELEIWWYKSTPAPAGTGFSDVAWPSVVSRHTLVWPEALPNYEADYAEIVLARNDGSGELGVAATGSIYRQPDPAKPGYNPNEEHALMSGGVAWALRDDLNVPDVSSAPYVLVDYTAGDGRPGMVIRKVVRENADHKFRYAAVAGTPLQGPMPLPLMTPALDGSGRSLNREINHQTSNANVSEGGIYSRFTYKDRKGGLWVYRGPHDSESGFLDGFEMQYFYTTREGFDFPDATTGANQTVAAGTVQPYLRPLVNPANPAQGYADGPLPVAFFSRWPGSAPVLRIGETLTLAKRGLPAVRGQSTIRVLYDQAVATGDPANPRQSVILHDPTRQKVAPLSEVGLEAIPGGIQTSDYLGKTYFPSLPPHLANRFFYDPNIGTHGALVLQGQFIDEVAGEDILRLNVLTAADLQAVVDLCPDDDTTVKTKWKALFGPAAGPAVVQGPFIGDQTTKVINLSQLPLAGWVSRNGGVVADWLKGSLVPYLSDGTNLYYRGVDFTTGEWNGGYYLVKMPGSLMPDNVTIHALIDPALDEIFDLDDFIEEIGLTDLLDIAVDVYNQYAQVTFQSPPTTWRASLDTGASRIADVHVSATSGGTNYQEGRDYTVDAENGILWWNRGGAIPVGTEVKVTFRAYAGAKGLRTTLETLVEDRNRLGNYRIATALSYDAGPMELAEIGRRKYDATALAGMEASLAGSDISVNPDNIPVDSYALTAAGGGTGYVVLAMGDGAGLAAPDAPVSLQVIRVEAPLARGELKVLPASNPLSEKVTLHHSGDFAAKPETFIFEWRKALPVSGLPPALLTYTAERLFPESGAGGTWRSRNNPTAAEVEAARGPEFQYPVNTPDNPAPEWAVIGQLEGAVLTVKDGGGTAEHGSTLPHMLLRETFAGPADQASAAWLSIDLGPNESAAVYLNGHLVASRSVPGAEDTPNSMPSGLITDAHALAYALEPARIKPLNVVTIELYTLADPDTTTSCALRIDALNEQENLTDWPVVASEAGKFMHSIEGATIETLADTYFTMRYRAVAGTAAAWATGGSDSNPGRWSSFTTPQLAEGWIKRALAGINPFNQRVTDLFNNSVNTDVSLLTQAGKRWEGDVALNLENIDDFGLIEIYETILRRGKTLSIDGAPPLNVPAANDALLLAAGYLNDLYMLVGNEAYADAANPTIAFDTAGGNPGEFNTALFAFKGQMASVLEEELGLLRGRDDFLQPGVIVAPYYNRLVWNFTRGINGGEAIYSLNYNILDQNADGQSDETDAAVQFPQGHGDALGHYLTALTVYYDLLHNNNFSWTPRIEAVLVGGQPVSVDYQDERKFATAAAAWARTAHQVLDLTYRNEYDSNENSGWSRLEDGKVNSATGGTTRYWGTDEWATRAGQGAFFHWVTANSILPAEDTQHTGIQKVDRTTVPELDEVTSEAEAIQRTLDQADARLNPLGLAPGALSFDISPSEIDAGKTHFEQIFDRAKGALGNAVFAFNSAKQTTQFLRQQDNSAAEQRAAIEAQERAFENELIEIYGTPYPDAIGPGKVWKQGYAGPDYVHPMYVDSMELFFGPDSEQTFEITDIKEIEVPDIPEIPGHIDLSFGAVGFLESLFLPEGTAPVPASDGTPRFVYNKPISYTLTSRGQFMKPKTWTGRRAHPGRYQTAVSNILSARLRALQALNEYMAAIDEVTGKCQMIEATVRSEAAADNLESEFNKIRDTYQGAIRAYEIAGRIAEQLAEAGTDGADALADGLPKTLGVANDTTFIGRLLSKLAGIATKASSYITANLKDGAKLLAEDALANYESQVQAGLETLQVREEFQQTLADLQQKFRKVVSLRPPVDQSLRALEQAERELQQIKAEGLARQVEREAFRKRAAAIVQGYRTRDLAFRVFRDEALEKYKALFDLAARYSYLAAKAYDYETGLLDRDASNAAAKFYNGIVQSRALGVVDSGGNPQFSASSTGDPGIAGVMARMAGDWSVVRSRLGFNNPDRYRTTFSLRGEKFRIVPGPAGDGAWADRLASFTMTDVLDDPDVRRYCMQIAGPDGLPVPGMVIPFETTIAEGFNFFGQPLAGGDHGFSPTSFATKIRASGIAFDGYIGMDSPTSIGGDLDGIGAASPPDPDLGFLDPNALSATPYIYLIPAGVDSMRSPPLGDAGTVRTWTVNDQAIPLPFNIGQSDFAQDTGFVSGQSLSEDPFAIRKHQAFRAVPGGTVFSSAPGFTNSRLIGRSVWNSSWKIVIPGRTLRQNPDVGLEVFKDTVKDIRLFLESYSYSGN